MHPTSQPSRAALALGAALALALGAGCTPTGQQQVSVSIAPSTVDVKAGATRQFSAIVYGASDATVTWSVVEEGGGTVSARGLYTAPAAAGTYTVRATSRADTRVHADAKVSVTVAPAVHVSLTPQSKALLFGEQVAFSATVSNAADTAVTWSVEGGEANGTVTAEGVYTAPQKEGTFRVVATSVAAPGASASATVTVTKPPMTVQVTPARVKVRRNGSVLLRAEILHGAPAPLQVHMVGEGAGTVSVQDMGVVEYSAPETPGSYTLVVGVSGHPEVSTEVPITVTEEEPLAVLRGSVHYAGEKTGRIYVSYGAGDFDGRMVGANATTSLAAAGDFTLQPLRNPFRERLVVMAFMDVLGTGVYNAAVDPAVTVPIHFGGEDLRVELTLQEPAAGAPPVVESEFWPFGGSDHLLVTFGPATSAGLETAEEYALYWSRTENPGPTNHEGTLTVQAGTSQLGSFGYTVAIPHLEAGAWYVGLAARRAGQESAVKATPFPTQVGETGGDVMMSGTVHLEGLQAQGSLQVVAVSEWMEVFTTRVPVTGADLSWSFTNLWGGEYTVYVLLDEDGDGRFAAHEPGVRSGVTVKLAEGVPLVVPAIVLDAAEVRTSLLTSAWGEYSFDFSSIRTTSEVRLRVLPGSRQPVRVQLTGGEGLPVPFDVPMKDGGFVLRESFLQALPIPAGTTFLAEVTYADGSTASLPLVVSGVMPVPVFTSPVGSASSTTPTFVWTLPEGVPETAVQRLEVKSTLSFGGVVWSHVMDAGVRSVEYNADGSGNPLFADGQYGWSYVLEDAHGNRASLSAIFTTPAE